MRPRERRESGQQDLFRARLDQILDRDHPLVKLAHTIDWGFLETQFGAAYTDGSGHPPLPTRLPDAPLQEFERRVAGLPRTTAAARCTAPGV